jgi:hypothetical protein
MRIAHRKFTISLLAPQTALVSITRIFVALAFVTLVCAGSALAQDQDNSLAAAARRAQEAKKDQPKAARVWDNSNIPSTGGVNVVGQQSSAAGSNAATTDSTTSIAQTVDAKPAPTKAELASLNSDLASAKQRLADLKADLDVAQRKYTLDQATYVSNPNHVNDRAGASALDAEKSDIDTKAEAVALAEKLLASAQTKVDEAGKQSAAADKAAQDKSAQDKAASTSASSQPPPAAPAAPASTVVPDSDTATVNR